MSTKRKSVILKTTVFLVMFLCLLVSSFGLQTAQAASARKLNYTKKNVEVSKTFTLKVNNLQSGDTIKYASSDKSIATISSKGVVKGIAPGEATVAATVTGKDKSKVKLTCKVTVKEMRVPTISGLTLNKDGDFIIGSSSIAISFKVDKDTTATISVCDSFHEAVYEKSVNVKKNKVTKFTWKGLDNNGENASDDSYYFRVDCDNATANTESFAVTDTSDFSKGNGSKKNPYQIKTIDDFRLMAVHNNCNFILMKDIDAAYEPLQDMFSVDVPFNGTLDGNGYTIKNLMNTTVMFHAIGENSVIKNLNLDNVNLGVDSYDSDKSSLLVGTSSGLIEQCTINNVSMTGYNAALFVGDNYGIVKNCKADGQCSGIAETMYQGGLVAWNAINGKVMDCASAVDYTSGDNIGGIVGHNNGMVVSCIYSGEISDCYAKGAFACSNSGTFVSCSYLGTQVNIDNIYNNWGIVK